MIARWQKDTVKICAGSFTLQSARGLGGFFTIEHKSVVEKIIGVHCHMLN